MYVYYEEFGSMPNISLVEIVLSSWGTTAQIEWKNQKEKAQFEIINAYLKSVSNDKRSYDAQTKIWSYVGSTGVAVVQAIQAGINGGLLQTTQLKKITDLQDKVAKGQLNRVDKPKVAPSEVEIKFSEEDFFYTPEPTTAQISGELLWKKLSDMLSVPLEEVKLGDQKSLKRAYFKAAMKYHPDRNNGDGSKMSELNMLWAIYTG